MDAKPVRLLELATQSVPPQYFDRMPPVLRRGCFAKFSDEFLASPRPASPAASPAPAPASIWSCESSNFIGKETEWIAIPPGTSRARHTKCSSTASGSTSAPIRRSGSTISGSPADSGTVIREKLGLGPANVVAEIGSGCGFVGRTIAPHVKRLYCVEHHPGLPRVLPPRPRGIPQCRVPRDPLRRPVLPRPRQGHRRLRDRRVHPLQRARPLHLSLRAMERLGPRRPRDVRLLQSGRNRHVRADLPAQRRRLPRPAG